MDYALLLVFILPTLSVPLVYFAGKKSPKAAALIVALIALINIGLVLTTVPTVLNSTNHEYIENYAWIPVLI
jgi:NADH:ubiquinone oxidoreductase subunit 5 (subunit L)/multisubunit Na+/H+ antiporter MnhA subunit